MTLKWALLALVVVVVVAAILTVLLRTKRATPEGAWPFFAKKPLTQPEQVLYFRLVRALPDSIVLAQVQLSRFLGVKKGERLPELAQSHQPDERGLRGVREGRHGSSRHRTGRRLAPIGAAQGNR
jgi:hypothetical protein